MFLVDIATHYGQVMPMLYASYPQINPQVGQAELTTSIK